MLIDGERETRTFNSVEDVWQVVDLIIEETLQFNHEQGKDFDIGESVVNQLPFFACQNSLVDISIQKDVERYIYCEKFGVSPYSGSYGEQPASWVKRSFQIRKALAKKEKRDINAGRSRKNNNKI